MDKGGDCLVVYQGLEIIEDLHGTAFYTEHAAAV